MRQLQVRLKSKDLAEFVVVDPDVVDKLRLVHSRIPKAGPGPSGPHALVASLLRQCVRLTEWRSPVSGEFRAAMTRHVAYHRRIIAGHSPTDIAQTAGGMRVRPPHKVSANGIRQCVAELIAHLASGFDVSIDLVGTPELSDYDLANPLFDLLPRSVYSLQTEAQFNLIAPWFMRSLEVPGDLCEIGCFRGTMSIKMAFALKTMGIDKTVFAFDTFEGFMADDPDGGKVSSGYYKPEEATFEELERWSRVIPVRPVKGDATQTSKLLKDPLSFVWLDLDHGALMRPVFETIWPLVSDRTVVGVDDVGRIDGTGRQVTPGVELWVDEMVAAGRLTELERHPADYMRFYRPNK